MQRFGGVVILMLQSFNAVDYPQIRYMVGNPETLFHMKKAPVKVPFDEQVLDFLNTVSKQLMSTRAAKAYPDVITLAFWLRRASTSQLSARFPFRADCIHLGRGTVFHIAPSNVPVNYAYSLAAGLLTGNANIVRIPSKDFPQVGLINHAIEQALESHPQMCPYICLVKYGRDQQVNDLLSAMADVRVIWGGDQTIAEIRKSPLPPRAGEITFADRFSLSILDSDTYIALENKRGLADSFYNDTYLTDQNACTSPRLVVWTGTQKEQAKAEFWAILHDLVSERYTFQSIQAVNKLTSSFLAGVAVPGAKIEPRQDNLIVRIHVPQVTRQLIDLRDNSGFFFEYDCDDILDLKELCSDNHCQTIGFLGDSASLQPLLLSGIRGIDRVVPIGKTMDFDLIWDGYDLTERLTRSIAVHEV